MVMTHRCVLQLEVDTRCPDRSSSIECVYMHLLESGLACSSVFTPLMHMLGKADARIDPEVLTNECAGKITE